MYVDKYLTVMDSTALTADSVSTNSVNLGSAKDLTYGKQLYLVTVIDTQLVSAGTDTSLNIQVVTDTTDTLATPTIQCQTGEIEEADLTANRAKIVLPVVMPAGTEEQYLGARFEVGTEGDFTAGAITSFFTFDP